MLFRWALSQRLMYMYDELKNSPLHLVAKIAPWSASSAVLVALLVDGRRLVDIFFNGWSNQGGGGGGGQDSQEVGGVAEESEHHHDGMKLLGGALGFIFMGGIASFFLLLVEVKLLQLTSSLTVGVLGSVKVRVSEQ
jgi:hypothetical protein